ncbi:hypothetical protein GCM10027051_21810 [Niabella terrae]
MEINHHNYQDFFLRYVDNELSAEQRALVDAFISQEPLLKAELESLLRTRLSADVDLIFPGKTRLMRLQSAIGTEDLLDYLDGECDPSRCRQIEAELLQNPVLSEELRQLRAARFHPDPAITYPRKAQLFRHEMTPWGIDWRQLAAAASVILLIGAWFLLESRQTDPNGALPPLADNDSGYYMGPTAHLGDTDASTAVSSSIPETRPAVINREPVDRHPTATAQVDVQDGPKTKDAEQPAPSTRQQDPEKKLPPPPEKMGTTVPDRQPSTTVVTKPAARDNENQHRPGDIPPVVKLPQPPKQPVAAADPESEKKGFLKKIGKKIGERALDILSNGGDEINVAGVAINIER